MSSCIVSLTNLKTIPETCKDCTNDWCGLPLSVRRNGTILKPYLSKRHKDCPLRLVDEINLEGVK